MATNQDLPATDSATVLHDLVGDDATAAFENDPKFADSNPGVMSSSENLQNRADRQDVQSQPDLKLRDTSDDDSGDDDDAEDEDEDDEDLDDEDADEDEDLDDEDDEDLDDEDEDDDDEYEDDEDEVEDEDEE